MCIVMTITYSQVTLAKGWIFPTCGTDLLAFPPLTPFESQNNNDEKEKKQSNNPPEAVLHSEKGFCLVLPVFVPWLHSYPPSPGLNATTGNLVVKTRKVAR